MKTDFNMQKTQTAALNECLKYSGIQIEIFRNDKYSDWKAEIDTKQHDKLVRADAIKEVAKAMYHQCFECDNEEDMQKWDSGNWFRYKLFENVIEQLNEGKNEIDRCR